MSARVQGVLFAECADVIHRFYLALDAGEYEALVAQMLPDGVWVRQGKTLEGRHAVLAALAQREPGVITTHLVQNLVVDQLDDDTATASMYVMVLRHEGDQPHRTTVPMPPIRAVQLVRDKLVRTSNGWRIAHKAGGAIFRSTP